MKTISYGRQYIGELDIKNVIDTLKSDWLTQGPKVEEFEQLVAKYHNCKYAVALSSGTAALHAAYYVSSKFPFGKKGKCIKDLNESISWHKPSHQDYSEFCQQYWEFITTPISFAATANAGIYCGGAPKFVDIDLNTYCIHIERIEGAITEDTRVITPVSYSGYPVDIEAIRQIPAVKEYNICIIHDASHAFGAKRNGHGIADFADMTVLSFHPVKHITTGEGGMVLTNNKAYYDKLLLFRSHGITKQEDLFLNTKDGGWYYEMHEMGYNYRLPDIQCALGIGQAERINESIFQRNSIATIYEREFSTFFDITCPPGFDKHWISNSAKLSDDVNDLHSYHLFPILLKDKEQRRSVYDFLKERGVSCQIHYIPITELPYYKSRYETKADIFTNSNDFYQRTISLPMYYGLSTSDLERVISLVKDSLILK